LTAQAECEMAQNWGLVPGTYEGGWAVQGDFDHYSMLAWNDLRYGSEATNPELTKQALRNAFDIWCQQGGYVYAHFYPFQQRIGQMDAPLLKCIQEMNDRLSAAPQAGTTLPATLNPETNHWQGGVDNRYWSSWSPKQTPAELPAHSWKSWIVTSPETADYTITLYATGGRTVLCIDDAVVAEGNAVDSPNGMVRLSAGVHAIKLKALEQPITVEKIKVARANKEERK
jgi:hypothetical protein